jgi:hypothetical protein
MKLETGANASKNLISWSTVRMKSISVSAALAAMLVSSIALADDSETLREKALEHREKALFLEQTHPGLGQKFPIWQSAKTHIAKARALEYAAAQLEAQKEAEAAAASEEVETPRARLKH